MTKDIVLVWLCYSTNFLCRICVSSCKCAHCTNDSALFSVWIYLFICFLQKKKKHVWIIMSSWSPWAGWHKFIRGQTSCPRRHPHTHTLRRANEHSDVLQILMTIRQKFQRRSKTIWGNSSWSRNKGSKEACKKNSLSICSPFQASLLTMIAFETVNVHLRRRTLERHNESTSEAFSWRVIVSISSRPGECVCLLQFGLMNECFWGSSWVRPE